MLFKHATYVITVGFILYCKKVRLLVSRHGEAAASLKAQQTCLYITDEQGTTWPFSLDTFFDDRVVHFIIPIPSLLATSSSAPFNRTAVVGSFLVVV